MSVVETETVEDDETPWQPGSGEMFDAIAARYDFVNRVLSGGLDILWRKRTARAVARDGAPHDILDLATGTGDLAIELARRYADANVQGLDPSRGMLAVGHRKLAKLHLDDRIHLIEGDAQQLPYDDESFDACTMAFGIRNVPDRDRALREIARVLQPLGRVGILELNEPKRGLLSRAARFWIRSVVPRLGAWLSGDRQYRYLQESIAAFPPPDEFAAMMEAADLEVLSVRPQTFGVCCLYVAQRRAS